MKAIQALTLALACLAAGEASAQVAASGRPCQDEFMELQKEREQRGLALKQAQGRKPERAEFCGLIKTYSAVESKVVKFMETNNVWCGIPPQAVEQIKTVHAGTQKALKTVCSGGPGPGSGGPPPPPSLSDVLGTSRVPDSTSTRPGRGTLDTLTGNPLGR
jgi:hypothetical protein